MSDKTVKHVMDSFIHTVDNLNVEIRKTVEKYSDAAEPERAYYVHKLINKWFVNGGKLK